MLLMQGTKVPEWPWPISKLVQERSAAAATDGFLDAATSATRCCRNSRDEIHDTKKVCGKGEERKVGIGLKIELSCLRNQQ